MANKTNIDNAQIEGFDPSTSGLDGQHPQQPDSISSPSTDAFDLDRLRLPQDFGSVIGVKKIITTVPIRKPHRQEFVRVHPDEARRLQTAVIEIKEDRETYLIDPSLWPELSDEVVPKILFTTITRQGDVFLWPIRLPGSDGRLDNWNQSAIKAAEHAMQHWIRVSANMSLGAYELWRAGGELDEPTWPDMSFAELMQIAIKDRWITTYDHPVLKRLRGEL